MTPRFAVSIGASILCVLTLSACESPPTGQNPPDEAGTCTGLAEAFVLIAENRDRGASRESQLEVAYESIRRPSTPDPDGTLRYLLQTIDFVYRRPDVSAEGIEALVVNGCIVNSEGRSVLYLPQP